MVIRLLAFGICRDIIGGSTGTVTVPENCSVSMLLAELKKQHPRLQELRSLAVAIDGAYATDATIISPTSEVALIPPVSGG